MTNANLISLTIVALASIAVVALAVWWTRDPNALWGFLGTMLIIYNWPTQ